MSAGAALEIVAVSCTTAYAAGWFLTVQADDTGDRPAAVMASADPPSPPSRPESGADMDRRQ